MNIMRNVDRMTDYKVSHLASSESVSRGFWELIQFESKGDHRGNLIAIEGLNDIPFDIKRVYYLIKTKENVRRGYHAHLNLDQVLLVVSGSCKVMVDDGNRKEEFKLDNVQKGLRIKNLVWREMFEFSSDCVLLVLASDHYNEEDYIRDYSEFTAAVRIQK